MADTVDILIVDDKINNLIALEDAFSDIDAVFIKATSGNDALREVLKHDFALAILDVQMPEMDGYELAQLIRNRKQTSKLPIIFLSAIYSDDFHVFKGYDSGAVDFITKPFLPEILAGKIRFFIEIYLQKIRLKETIHELQRTKQLVLEQNRQLKRLSTHDDLTGLYNRRHLVVSLEQEFSRCRRHGTELSLVMLDLDHFKNINDNFGHEFGDYVLKEFSALLRETVRKSDLVFRFGGEEFIVLLPQTAADGAAGTAEKIRQKCAERLIDDGEYAVKITVSIGVTSYNKELHRSAGCMISFADEALYKAKEGGRNRVVVYQGKGSRREKEILLGEKV
ncbi:diguanylate cyclase (GGDEF) domain-containing protein [Candidatus Electrothrix marina]|uniref:diguanylate cyclase n=1 Tax=Candidatus Electrothrix marina TaxID=1859130 RepID=A0A3S3QKU6_9BACT|nr:diguanylate cyclase (GGDEF) domain-containing protein [Candidatus Electrothrix marina]RWX50233.1 diguanylate cyclase (GGDEF) domain-containing protein [Candidatus Electrothrix marina]RWX52206.1 diguanylate cyclase (GGDEF) domain-containing protein [Candidatus Electrothrix marina]